MVRLLLYAAIAALICKQITGRWPWDYLQGQTTRSQAVSRARTLLGVSANANRQDILEAHKRLIGVVHPDRGGTNDQVHEANAARDLLLNSLSD